MGNASAGGLAFVPAGTGASGPSIVIAGNTSGTTASVSSGTLNLAGGNGITLSQNGQSITISGGGSQSVQTQAAGNIAGVGTTTSGNVSMTLNSAGLSLNAVNLAGTGTAITGNASITLNSTGLSFNGSNLVGVNTSTASVTNGVFVYSANSSGVTISEPYLTRYMWPPLQVALTPIAAPVNASASFQYVPVFSPVSGSRIDALMLVTGSTSAATNTAALVISAYAAIYTVNGNSISSLSSGSTQTTYTWASNTAGASGLSQTAIRPVSVPINFNMGPGEYIVGFNIITNSTSSIGANTTALGQTFSMMGGTMQSSRNFADWTAITKTSGNLLNGMGVLASASTGLSGVYGLSDIAQQASSQASANICLVFRNA